MAVTGSSESEKMMQMLVWLTGFQIGSPAETSPLQNDFAVTQNDEIRDRLDAKSRGQTRCVPLSPEIHKDPDRSLRNNLIEGFAGTAAASAGKKATRHPVSFTARRTSPHHVK